MLDSLRWLRGNRDVHVVISDNSCATEELLQIQTAVESFPNVQMLESSVNRGYFGGAVFALEQYLASGHALPDWTIVCNHDLRIEDEGFFAKLLREDPSTLGVIAPQIQTMPGGLHQNPFMRRRPGSLR